MARDMKGKAAEEIPQENENIQEGTKPQGSDKKGGRKSGFLFAALAFLTAVLIIGAVAGGAFYIVVHNNVNGLADKYRKDIQGIPLLSLALPKVADPDDSKYIPDSQIRKKYTEYKNKADELKKQIEALNKEIEALKKTNGEMDKIKALGEKIKKEAADKSAQADAKLKQLEEDRKAFNQLVASGDKDGFRQFYEKLDKVTADNAYKEIMKEQKASEDAVKFAKVYESMEPANAASIFEQLGAPKIDLVVDILKNMKKDASAAVLSNMTPAYASKVTEKLSKIYLVTPAPKPK